MQIEIYTPTQGQPLPPVEWNYETVKQWVQDGLEAYKGRVYTDETISEAKRDRANLNKLADAIDTKRKEMKAVYLAPYEQFEAQAKELTAMVKEQSAEIDAQVKTYEKFKKGEKLEQIRTELYAPMIGKLAGLVPYEALHDPKWLNATTSMSAVSEALGAKIDRIISGLDAIDKLDYPADIVEYTKGVFLRDFDLAEAIAEKDKMVKQREELARYETAQNAAGDAKVSRGSATPPDGEKLLIAKPAGCEVVQAVHATPEETVQTIELDFRVWVTKDQMTALREFLKSNGIKFGRVPKESEV